MPVHSPGARIHDGAGTSTRTKRCVDHNVDIDDPPVPSGSVNCPGRLVYHADGGALIGCSEGARCPDPTAEHLASPVTCMVWPSGCEQCGIDGSPPHWS